MHYQYIFLSTGESAAVQQPAAAAAAAVVAHGGRRETVWSAEKVNILLLAIRDFYDRLSGRDEKRGAVWRDIFASVTNQVGMLYLQSLIINREKLSGC